MQQRKHSRFLIGLLSVGVLIAGALTASSVQAQTTSVGPYYAMPSWDQTLPSATRFVVLLDWSSKAVLDRETGLVWEQSPATTTHDWTTARSQCTSRTTGGRKGWRLPSVHELASLIDPSVAFPGLALQSGHPFTNVSTDAQSPGYWSASSDPDVPAIGWDVFFTGGFVFRGVFKTSSLRAWCVRGGTNADRY